MEDACVIVVVNVREHVLPVGRQTACQSRIGQRPAAAVVS